MPRQPDPDLEERILQAADTLWKRGGEKALTMRAVARAAHTNTPAVYRRFKDRHDILRGLLLRIVERVRQAFEAGESVEDMLEAYVDYAVEEPHEYELFYQHLHELDSRKKSGQARPIRESRPNFGLLEQRLGKRLGGGPEDRSQLALALWALAHGTTTLLISKSVPDAHREALRSATRAAVKAMLEGAGGFRDDR